MGISYYIAGSDGSGKTSYLKEVEQQFIQQKIKIKHIWIRSPKITSKPLMLFCRIIGLTQYKVINGVKYGKHEFYRSKFISWLFPILQLIDFNIKWHLIKRKIDQKEVILFDRFALDTLADIMVDTRRMNLHKTRFGRAFIKFIPINTKLIVLHADESVIRSRKIDTLYDEHLTEKIKVYQLLAKDLNLNVVNNNKEFLAVKADLFKALDI